MGACDTNVTSWEGPSFEKRTLFGRGVSIRSFTVLVDG